MSTVDKEVYRQTLKFLRENKKYPDAPMWLRILLSLEDMKRKKLGAKYELVGIRPGEVKDVPPFVFPILSVIYGVLRPIRTNTGTGYVFVDRNAVAMALMAFEGKVPEELETQKAEIPDNLFEDIVGYENHKKLVLKALRAPRPVHLLFTGPPGTAKTLMMLDLAQLPGAHYVIGSRASKAGIAEFIYKTRPKYLIIDEIDKMSRENQAVLLSLMETGIVSTLMHKQAISIRVDTRVIGACNRKDRLLPELLDRFTIVEFPAYKKAEFLKLVPRVLEMKEGVKKELAEYIAKRLVDYTTSVRDAIKIARMSMSKEDVDMLIEMLFKRKIARL